MRNRRRTSGNHIYDKNQAVACSTSCIMPRGLMKNRHLITMSDIFIIIYPQDISFLFS